MCYLGVKFGDYINVEKFFDGMIKVGLVKKIGKILDVFGMFKVLSGVYLIVE